jgi:hypothetical protein
MRRPEQMGQILSGFMVSRLFDQSIIFRMRPDPEPKDGVFLFQSEGAPSDSDAHRIHGRFLSNQLESDAGMMGVGFPKPIIFASLPPNSIGQQPETREEFVGQF